MNQLTLGHRPDMTSDEATSAATAEPNGDPLPDRSDIVPVGSLAGADPLRALTDVACDVGNRLRCDACSIYRLDRQRQRLILSATVGLRQSCVDSLQMAISEGLCGLVVQQGRAVCVTEQASQHPRFKYFPESGEEPFDTFLGVPVIDAAQIVGVLVVQTLEAREYSTADQQALALIGRQIGPLVSQVRRARESS